MARLARRFEVKARPGGIVNKKVLVASMLVTTVALAGLGAFVLLDDGSGGTAGRSAPEKARTSSRGSDPGDGFRDVPPAGAVDPTAPGAGTGLSAGQEEALRAALEKAAAEGALVEALSGGVPQPWPLPEAQAAFRTCKGRVTGTLPKGSAVTEDQLCSCATRYLQKVFPKQYPNPGTRNAKRAYQRQEQSAISACQGKED
jgi:hypothetical protein